MKPEMMIQEGFRKPDPIQSDPNYYICGGRYSYDEIEAMDWAEFGCRRDYSMPGKLYKYYPNTVSREVNRSIQALENNTVYLQEVRKFDDNYDCTLSINEEEFARRRIAYYAEICGMKTETQWNYEKCAFEFSLFLYSEMKKGRELENIFCVAPSTENDVDVRSEQDLLHANFCLRIKLKLNENCKWPDAFYEAIHNEYLDMVNVMDRFRVACFTTSPYMINMWSNQYADNNRGFCVEYQIPDLAYRVDGLRDHLFPVVYSDARTDVLNKCLATLQTKRDRAYLNAIYKYGVLAKSKSIWGQQDEWRLVSYDNMLADDYNCKFYLITKVYLGERMAGNDRRRIVDICERKGIPYIGVVRDKEKYQMVECKQCDLMNN